MGAPLPDMEPVENPSAEALLDSLKTIDPKERRKHASVFNYWQSIRGPRRFPPIRDLDPLEISDAGPWSILLEMIGGGEDAVVRHFGQAIKGGLEIEKIGDAPSPSLLACIHAKLPLVAACREAFAFEESYDTGDGAGRCWVTLLPFSQTGTWIDYVYGYVSLEGAEVADDDVAEAPPQDAADAMPEAVAEEPEAPIEEPEAEIVAEDAPEPFKVELKAFDEEPEAFEEGLVPEASEPEPEPELEPEPEPTAIATEEPRAAAVREPHPEPEAETPARAGFPAKFLGGLATSFYGKIAPATPETVIEPQPEAAADPVPEAVVEAAPEPEPETRPEPIIESAHPVEGILHSKLTDVRSLAQQAREAQIRSNVALYEGLSAAYDFALDAEDEPEEYLRLVEAQGLKIQLRSPMKPVVKLAFDGMCDEPTIKQLEAVLAWALKQDLPKGTLAARIQEAGGLGPILNGQAA